MSTIINSFLSSLREIMSQLNPHVIKAFPEDQAATIWTEGGEWPAYHERYESYVPGDVVRNLDALSYASANSIDNALAAVSNGFNNHRETAVSMDCGLGKSTLLVRELHSCKYGRRTIVVEPSSLVAASIAKYIDRHDVSSVLLNDQLNSTRGIYYMSAGVFLHMYLTNNIHQSDLIILDEAHTCTFVYSVTREILTRAHNRLVLMTASTTNRVKALPNVVVYDIKRDRKMNPLTQVASHGEHLIVGVYDDSSYATPANCMVGATIPGLMSVFDTGLRPDPRVDNDQLLPGERIATISEVIQMLGRIGRTDKRGSVYYDSSPAAMRDQPGVALYDILQKAILVYLKLTPGDREFAMRLWKTSGLSTDQPSCNDIKTSPDPTDSGFSSSPPMANESSCSTFVKHEDTSHVELPSSLTAVANARPFMRANIEHVTPIKVNDASLQRYWANVITSMNHGDSVFPEPLRIDASSQVDVISQDECRLVVSGRILADFSEREMLGVISVWNKYVRSLRGRPADNNRLSMFIKYFAEAYAFDVTRF